MASNRKEDEKKILQLIENWAKAVRERNIEAILAHHSMDVVMYDVPKPFQSTGIDAYRKTWDLFFKFTKPGVFEIHEIQVVADENVAFCFATMQCADRNEREEFVELNFRLTIGLKKIKGEWTIVHEHRSVTRA